jgi:hypothetical protein
MSDEKSPDELRQERERAAREANQKRNNERLERLEQIANQSDELKTKDGLEDIPDEAWEEGRTGRPPSEGGELEAPERVIADAEAADKAADEARDAGAQDVKVVNGETHYLLVVNGQERWLTLQQIRDTASKVSAADQYLHDAKEAARKAVAAPPSQPDEVPSPKGDRARDLLNRALMGEQEAVDELAQLIEARPSRVTPDVLQAVDERVDGRLTFRTAVEWFDDRYKEELADPELKKRIIRRDKEMATLYPDMDFRERLKEVGEEARALRIARGRTAPVSEDRLREKEQRKASVRALPQAAGRQVEESEDEDGETYESAIQQIAKARGQSRPVVHKR